jgi:hypothetical protein
MKLQSRCESPGGEYGSALQAASYDGHDATVKLLVENKEDVHLQSE